MMEREGVDKEGMGRQMGKVVMEMEMDDGKERIKWGGDGMMKK